MRDTAEKYAKARANDHPGVAESAADRRRRDALLLLGSYSPSAAISAEVCRRPLRGEASASPSSSSSTVAGSRSRASPVGSGGRSASACGAFSSAPSSEVMISRSRLIVGEGDKGGLTVGDTSGVRGTSLGLAAAEACAPTAMRAHA